MDTDIYLHIGNTSILPPPKSVSQRILLIQEWELFSLLQRLPQRMLLLGFRYILHGHPDYPVRGISDGAGYWDSLGGFKGWWLAVFLILDWCDGSGVWGKLWDVTVRRATNRSTKGMWKQHFLII